MTSVSGYSIIATPCCSSLYSTLKYSSINLSASEYWTDGYKEGSLFNNGGGLRKCKCGAFYLLRDSISLGFDADQINPPAEYINANDLPDVIRTANNKFVELAARREYWHYLNHKYREIYRSHREGEDKVSQLKWETEWKITYKKLHISKRLLNKFFYLKKYHYLRLLINLLLSPYFSPHQLKSRICQEC